MINGIINIYKEAGYTSHDVVARLRGIVKQRKIGHTGTLDPDAVGVLPVCFGCATKLCGLMTDQDKEYEARMRLGVTTDTQDMSGTVLTQAEVRVSETDVEAAVMEFVGGYEQVPPMYSARKVNGRKLYELAREGKEIERKPCHVDIPYIRILEMDLPEVRFVVGCSKGTYIRSLCADIGDKLGCGAAMAALVRTRAGSFRIEEAITLSQAEMLVASGTLDEYVAAPDSVLMAYVGADVKPEGEKALANGNRLYMNQLELDNASSFSDGELIRVYSGGHAFRALYTFVESESCLKPYKMFLG